MAALPQLKYAALSLTDRVALLTFLHDDVRNAPASTDLAPDIVVALTWANKCDHVSVVAMTIGGGVLRKTPRQVQG
jgi:hypothetical protein